MLLFVFFFITFTRWQKTCIFLSSSDGRGIEATMDPAESDRRVVGQGPPPCCASVDGITEDGGEYAAGPLLEEGRRA